MTRNPNQPDETIDEALLDEALSEASPAELEAKILELTDPTMLSLLDEALAPQANDQLTQRILAATQPGMAPVNHDAQDGRVLARIGPSTVRYAAAAAIALAVGLGVYFVNQDPETTDTTVVENTTNVEDDTAPDWLTNEQYASNDGFFEEATSPLETTLEEASNSIDDAAITRDTLWAELDAYEAFLDDIES